MKWHVQVSRFTIGNHVSRPLATDLRSNMTHELDRRTFIHRATSIGAAVLSARSIGEGLSSAAPKSEPQKPFKNYIDAHVHVWTPDVARYPLAPGFTKERMRPPSFTPQELFEH